MVWPAVLRGTDDIQKRDEIALPRLRRAGRKEGLAAAGSRKESRSGQKLGNEARESG